MELAQQFFPTVQNKMHWATHGRTAAEVIYQRVDATKLFKVLTATRSRPPLEEYHLISNRLAFGELPGL